MHRDLLPDDGHGHVDQRPHGQVGRLGDVEDRADVAQHVRGVADPSARTVCRRAEREAVSLAEAEDASPVALAYLNRLSDLLFILARAAVSGEEPLWKPGSSR